MSRVRFPSPAPGFSPISEGRFCRWFCTLCSLFVELPDDRLGGCDAVDVAADDPRDVLLLPAHDLGDDALRQAGDVEPCRRRAAPILEVKIACAPRRAAPWLAEPTVGTIA